MPPSSNLSSDSSNISKIEFIEGDGFVALDKTGKKLFTIFTYDNGPDYTSEGLFRIIENNKIGYSNEQGQIIIQPKFDAALPFQNELAGFCLECSHQADGDHSFWSGGKWGFINKTGEIVILPVYEEIISDFVEAYATVEKEGIVFKIDREGNKLEIPPKNYKAWTDLFAQALKLSGKLIFGDQLVLEINPKPNLGIYNFYDKNPGIVEVTVKPNGSNFPLVNYLLIPWQSFAITQSENLSISPIALYDILTVTDYAVIYTSALLVKQEDINFQYASDFDAAFKKLISIYENQNPEELENLNIPEGVQAISYEVFPNYISLYTAIPGSRMAEISEWEKVSQDRMLYLQQIPDIGQKKINWFKPSDSFYDTYYASVENELLSLFNSALENAIKNPVERFNIYVSTKNKMRELFNAANSYVNFLYDKYEKLLANWLQLGDEEVAYPTIENIFGDYQPKLTPDTVIDYMPSIHDEFVNLPSPELTNLDELLEIFSRYKKESLENPGKWEEGNMILGANPKEYRPSRSELLLAEVGKMINYILDNNSPENIKNQLDTINAYVLSLDYKVFSFIHYDVMGSERFFYIGDIEEKHLELP